MVRSRDCRSEEVSTDAAHTNVRRRARAFLPASRSFSNAVTFFERELIDLMPSSRLLLKLGS